MSNVLLLPSSFIKINNRSVELKNNPLFEVLRQPIKFLHAKPTRRVRKGPLRSEVLISGF